MRTGLSNVTREEFDKRVAELHQEHKDGIRKTQLTHEEMIAEFDRLMETGDKSAADELGEKIMCPKTWNPQEEDAQTLSKECQEVKDRADQLPGGGPQQ